MSPGPEEILRSLERLRALAGELAARETRFHDDARNREALALRRLEAARKSVREELQVAVERERASLQQAEERSRQHAHARALRIRQAQRTVRRAAAERTEAEEGRQKFELQRDMLRSTRAHEAGVAAADAQLAADLAELAARQAELTTLEAQAVALLGIYGGRFKRSLSTAHEAVRLDAAGGTDDGRRELTAALERARDGLARFRRRLLPRFTRAWPAGLILVLSPLVLVPVLERLGVRVPPWRDWGLGALAFSAVSLAVHFVGRQLAWPAGRDIADHLGRARVLLHRGREEATANHRCERERLDAEHAATTQRCNESWGQVAAWLDQNRNALPAEVDARAVRLLARQEAWAETHRERLRLASDRTIAHLQSEADARLDQVQQETTRARAGLAADREAHRRELAALWSREAAPVLAVLEEHASTDGSNATAPFPLPGPAWTPPAAFVDSVRFGRVDVDLRAVLQALPSDGPFPATAREPRSLPLLLRFPGEASLVLEADGASRPAAIGALNQVVAQLLAGAPAGRVSFTVYDPVGLGQSFAGLTHLADEADHLIHGRIWTQPLQLEERLAELGEHLEKVIQMYLRNDFATIAEYNAAAGNIAERYRFLVLADFPTGCTELALRRLLSIATTGARCGVYVLIHWDQRHALPAEFSAQTLRQAGTHLRLGGGPELAILNGRSVPGTTVRIDPAPDTAAITAFVQKVARANRDSHRVEVPFAHIAPAPDEAWTLDCTHELRVPLGRTGATKFQYLALGKGTRQHALVAGKTGSGKSTLFHVLVTNLALWYSPDEVEFYLVDFKKGVEFKCYATHRLPHARVVAIESDREFGLSVLQRLDEELRRRGELFRQARVQDLPGYRRTPGAQPMPRVLLLVDEFQEFFVEEDRVAQNASVLLDRIVRQGRAFGIHVVLGSQTLGGAYTLARSTLGQMVVRVALQCNEADAFLIMSEDNAAPRLLSRPGEAIYNDEAGARTGNSPFQVVWLPDDLRDVQLRRVRELADQRRQGSAAPLVFEGDAPAEIGENAELEHRLATPPTTVLNTVHAWLGAPNSIKGPTQITLAPRSGDNVLIIGQRDDAILALLGTTLLAFAAQFPRDRAAFALLDGSAPGSTDRAYLERLVGLLPIPVTLARPGDAGPLVVRWAEELRRRTGPATDGAENVRHFLFIHGLQHFRALRPEDEFALGGGEGGPSPSASFRELLVEGPAQGFHAVVTTDTASNALRCLGRKGLGEFGLRVLFQMSANDSATLIDNPAAARLGLHRALLHQDREGQLEIFRPYALPDAAWLDHAGRQLRQHGT